MEIGIWGLVQRSVFGCGVEIGFGYEVEIGVGCGDRRWVWDVEIAVRHGFPTFGSDLDGVGGGSSNLKTGLVTV